MCAFFAGIFIALTDTQDFTMEDLQEVQSGIFQNAAEPRVLGDESPLVGSRGKALVDGLEIVSQKLKKKCKISS